MQQIIQKLEHLGLTTAQAQIYVCLLTRGPLSVASIAYLSAIERTNCYHVLETLCTLHLVDVDVSSSPRIYRAQNPSYLQLIVQKKQQICDDIIPDLADLQNVSPQKPQTYYVDTPHEVYTELLNFGTIKKIFHIFGDSSLVFSDKSFTHTYESQANALNIAFTSINGCGEAIFDTVFKNTLKTSRNCAKKNCFDVFIYDEKVICIYGDNGLHAFTIMQKEIADILFVLCKTLWKLNKKVAK